MGSIKEHRRRHGDIRGSTVHELDKFTINLPIHFAFYDEQVIAQFLVKLSLISLVLSKFHKFVKL